MSITNEKVLSDKYANKVYGLYRNKKWTIDEVDGEISDFDRFCKRLADLENDEQRDLILELTEDYLKVTMKEYEELLRETWKKFFKEHTIELKKNERLVICPMLSEKDFGKVKSSTMMAYICQGLDLRRLMEFSEEQIRICSSPEKLSDMPCDIGMLILIDDYIGSGETGLSCVNYIRKRNNEINHIIILSLVAQREGINALKKVGIDVVSAIERKRGITDKYSTAQEIEAKKRIMIDIGKCLKVPNGTQLGYNDTEALVSMIRTPNNTFPVYWHEFGRSKAPFPRKDNIKVVK